MQGRVQLYLLLHLAIFRFPVTSADRIYSWHFGRSEPLFWSSRCARASSKFYCRMLQRLWYPDVKGRDYWQVLVDRLSNSAFLKKRRFFHAHFEKFVDSRIGGLRVDGLALVLDYIPR